MVRLLNPEHLKIVKKGASEIEKWWRNNRGRRLDLSEANLIEADLSGADLTYANLCLADLSEANLSNIFMLDTHFREIKAVNTKFHNSILGGADFVDYDLSQIEGLDTVKQFEPSSIGMDTLVKTFRSVRKGSPA